MTCAHSAGSASDSVRQEQSRKGSLLKYDAVVVGAGPGGSMAAYEVAAAGYSVFLLEKRKKPGAPVYCAEAVSRPSLEKLIEPRREWISCFIESARLVGPHGKALYISHPKAGYILDRERFDYDLARRAVEAGSTLECETVGLRLKKNGSLFSSIEVLKSSGEKMKIEASIFIAADGVESKIARLAGIDNGVDIADVESLLQYRVESISIDPTAVEFHMGNDLAPGGYLWVFPKSQDSANVGIGIATDDRRSDKLYPLLDGFIERKFNGAVISRTTCGLVPKYQGRDVLRVDNLLVVGDAGRTLDSLTGAGIINAMMSGKYAGLAAAEYLSGNLKNIAEIEELYPGRFLEVKEAEMSLYLKLREVYKRLSDGDFAEILTALDSYFAGQSTIGLNAAKLLVALVKTRPSLLRLVRHLL